MLLSISLHCLEGSALFCTYITQMCALVRLLRRRVAAGTFCVLCLRQVLSAPANHGSRQPILIPNPYRTPPAGPAWHGQNKDMARIKAARPSLDPASAHSLAYRPMSRPALEKALRELGLYSDANALGCGRGLFHRRVLDVLYRELDKMLLLQPSAPPAPPESEPEPPQAQQAPEAVAVSVVVDPHKVLPDPSAPPASGI